MRTNVVTITIPQATLSFKPHCPVCGTGEVNKDGEDDLADYWSCEQNHYFLAPVPYPYKDGQ